MGLLHAGCECKFTIRIGVRIQEIVVTERHDVVDCRND